MRSKTSFVLPESPVNFRKYHGYGWTTEGGFLFQPDGWGCMFRLTAHPHGTDHPEDGEILPGNFDQGMMSITCQELESGWAWRVRHVSQSFLQIGIREELSDHELEGLGPMPPFFNNTKRQFVLTLPWEEANALKETGEWCSSTDIKNDFERLLRLYGRITTLNRRADLERYQVALSAFYQALPKALDCYPIRNEPIGFAPIASVRTGPGSVVRIKQMAFDLSVAGLKLQPFLIIVASMMGTSWGWGQVAPALAVGLEIIKKAHDWCIKIDDPDELRVFEAVCVLIADAHLKEENDYYKAYPTTQQVIQNLSGKLGEGEVRSKLSNLKDKFIVCADDRWSVVL